jgi:hypothetical protein
MAGLVGTNYYMQVVSYRLFSEYGQICFPGTCFIGILYAHHSYDLGNMTQLMGRPGGKKCFECEENSIKNSQK